MRGRVEVVETLGNEKIVILTVGDHSVTARCAPSLDISVGSEFPFHFDTQRAHLFDSSGDRVVTGA
jgi:ABC-type sugar transport system ATPase subunit